MRPKAALEDSSSLENMVKITEQLETDEEYKARKKINAATAGMIAVLVGLSFYAPSVTFVVSLGVCVFLPFFRGFQKSEEEDTSNV